MNPFNLRLFLTIPYLFLTSHSLSLSTSLSLYLSISISLSLSLCLHLSTSFIRGNKGTIFVLKKADITTDPIAAFATKKGLNDNSPSSPSPSSTIISGVDAPANDGGKVWALCCYVVHPTMLF